MDARRTSSLSRSGLTVLAAVAAVVMLAAPARAVTFEERIGVLDSWTQPTAESQQVWLSANQDQGAWVDYAFDWSTDLCSFSPDEPLGFDFGTPCARHDFGYRNYKLVGLFDPNKDRVDQAFHTDMLAVCAPLPWWSKEPCEGLAWTYYQAVSQFGSLSAVRQADLDRAERDLARRERFAGVR